jgi:thiamine-phosphate pyrophosphorylase
MHPLDPRERLARARLMLIFTPGQPGADLERLAALAPEVDIVQVRAKAPGRRFGPSPAGELCRWTERAADRIATLPAERRPLLFVNDRPDVAKLLAGLIDGLHLGQEDTPPEALRAWLGPELLIGYSTHSIAQVARALELPIDCLGFGPVFPSGTKGYERGLGPERAQVAAAGSPLPLFPIGGIDLERANELSPVGRAAVGAALLEAADPVAAARALRAALEPQ